MRKDRFLWFAVLFFSGGAAFAQCGNPAGVAGQQKYNIAAIPNTMSVCNGTNWVSLSTAPGGSSGHVQFNNSGSFSGDSNLVWDNANKRLGIGTAAPAYALDVISAAGAHISTTATAGYGLYVSTYGFVGIGTALPGGLFSVRASASQAWAVYAESNAANGTAVVGTGSGSNSYGGYLQGVRIGLSALSANGYYGAVGTSDGYSLTGNGNIYTSGTYQGSDRRLKDDIRDMDTRDALGKMMRLKPVSFVWKPDADNARTHKGTQYGLIAQDVQPVLPNIVTEVETPKISKHHGVDNTVQSLNEKLGKVYGIDYTALVPWLLASVQELKAANDKLKAEFEAYKKTLP